MPDYFVLQLFPVVVRSGQLVLIIVNAVDWELL